mmetsp:Transcript_19490/g.40153  ORF Transcript_19490/g.40153 Transcript_19490/m.40153 type:complete len:157 (+) Transcript_19490:117-587(+)
MRSKLLLPLVASLLLPLVRNSESLRFRTSSSRSRSDFFVEVAAATVVVVGGGSATIGAANAAIDVSGLRVEGGRPVGARGQAPSNLKSGPLAGTKLGFRVGRGPRPEEEVRRIDEPRYAAVRKAQGLGPLWLEGVQIEQQQQQQQQQLDASKRNNK